MNSPLFFRVLPALQWHLGRGEDSIISVQMVQATQKVTNCKTLKIMAYIDLRQRLNIGRISWLQAIFVGNINVFRQRMYSYCILNYTMDLYCLFMCWVRVLVILPDKSFLSEKIEREPIQRSLVFMKLERPQEEETCRMISEIQ